MSFTRASSVRNRPLTGLLSALRRAATAPTRVAPQGTVGDPAVAARAGEDSDPDLRLGRPAAVPWCMMDPEPQLKTPGPGRRDGVMECRQPVRVEGVPNPDDHCPTIIGRG